MSCWALVPIKRRTEAKLRLSRSLAPEGRARLASSMFAHVLDAARASDAFAGIAVLSPAQPRLPHDITLLVDTGSELNESLDRAVRALHEERGASRVAVISADLACVSGAEVAALVAASAASGLALAPDRHERGTNAVCLTLPCRFRFQYGPDSFARHLAQAAALGVDAAIVRLPGLGFDVDEPEDLGWLASVHHR